MYSYNRYISAISFNRTRLLFAILGFFCLVHFPSFYKVVTCLLVCFKLVAIFRSPSAPNVLPPSVFHSFGEVDIGWFLVTSVSPLIIIHMILKSAQYVLRTITVLVHRLELETKIQLHLILLIEIIGIIFVLDNKLYHVQTVSDPLSPLSKVFLIDFT